MPKKTEPGLFLRVNEQDIQRLDQLVAQIEIATRSSLARTAMRIGLDAIERDPLILFKQSAPKEARPPKRKPGDK